MLSVSHPEILSVSRITGKHHPIALCACLSSITLSTNNFRIRSNQ
jgi:hypothetical protein